MKTKYIFRKSHSKEGLRKIYIYRIESEDDMIYTMTPLGIMGIFETVLRMQEKGCLKNRKRLVEETPLTIEQYYE